MRFLLDANLPARLADVFAAGGHECMHMETLLPRYAEDTDIALIANQSGAVLVSRDADFVQLSRSGRLRVPMVWVRLGNLRRAALATTIRDRLPAIVRSIATGENIIVLR
jgi:predicted nuclease of predicted toxin-antitoxin system